MILAPTLHAASVTDPDEKNNVVFESSLVCTVSACEFTVSEFLCVFTVVYSHLLMIQSHSEYSRVFKSIVITEAFGLNRDNRQFKVAQHLLSLFYTLFPISLPLCHGDSISTMGWR